MKQRTRKPKVGEFNSHISNSKEEHVYFVIFRAYPLLAGKLALASLMTVLVSTGEQDATAQYVPLLPSGSNGKVQPDPKKMSSTIACENAPFQPQRSWLNQAA
jgi:hypothetical protein